MENEAALDYWFFSSSLDIASSTNPSRSCIFKGFIVIPFVNKEMIKEIQTKTFIYFN